MAVSSMEPIAVELTPPETDDGGHANGRERPMFCAGDLGVVEGTS
jgi:hypothetical protein